MNIVVEVVMPLVLIGGWCIVVWGHIDMVRTLRRIEGLLADDECGDDDDDDDPDGG